MVGVLLAVLLLICVLAPWLGTATSDDRSEKARPAGGWFPPLSAHISRRHVTGH